MREDTEEAVKAAIETEVNEQKNKMREYFEEKTWREVKEAVDKMREEYEEAEER